MRAAACSVRTCTPSSLASSPRGSNFLVDGDERPHRGLAEATLRGPVDAHCPRCAASPGALTAARQTPAVSCQRLGAGRASRSSLMTRWHLRRRSSSDLRRTWPVIALRRASRRARRRSPCCSRAGPGGRDPIPRRPARTARRARARPSPPPSAARTRSSGRRGSPPPVRAPQVSGPRRPRGTATASAPAGRRAARRGRPRGGSPPQAPPRARPGRDASAAGPPRRETCRARAARRARASAAACPPRR